MSANYNVGSDWTVSDVAFLMNSIANGYTYDMVSKELKKDVSNVRRTLLSIICQKIQNGEGIEAYFCNEYGISSNEIREYQFSSIQV